MCAREALLLSHLHYRTVNQNVHPRPTHHHVRPLQHSELWRPEDGASFGAAGVGLGVSFQMGKAVLFRVLSLSDCTRGKLLVSWLGCKSLCDPGNTSWVTHDVMRSCFTRTLSVPLTVGPQLWLPWTWRPGQPVLPPHRRGRLLYRLCYCALPHQRQHAKTLSKAHGLCSQVRMQSFSISSFPFWVLTQPGCYRPVQRPSFRRNFLRSAQYHFDQIVN